MLQINNICTVVGTVSDKIEFSHKVYGETFYNVKVDVSRDSGNIDTLPVVISDRLIDVNSIAGKRVKVSGSFRSFNKHSECHNKLILNLFVTEISLITDNCDINEISLDGYICKPSIYRKTPLGREIADVLLAVNRPYGKSDYIPCICWGRNAKYADQFEVGTHIKISGRIQSREYQKKIGEDEFEKRVAYEVSVSKMECIDEDA